MSFGRTNYRSGGTRGGADQFKWDDVKVDKYRENYLGHSVNAPVGRWQKVGKDLSWYAKEKKTTKDELERERMEAKQRDEDMINEALGIPVRRNKKDEGNRLDSIEIKELLQRGQSERDDLDVNRIQGLGAAPTRNVNEYIPKKTLVEKYKEELLHKSIEEENKNKLKYINPEPVNEHNKFDKSKDRKIKKTSSSKKKKKEIKKPKKKSKKLKSKEKKRKKENKQKEYQ